MGRGSRMLHMRFAGFSPVFASRGIAARLVLMTSCAIPFFAPQSATAANSSNTTATSDSRRAAATAQFDRAEEQRNALNEKPANKRTLAEYKNVVTTYRRVFLITPRAPEVPESLSAVGQLYTEMGEPASSGKSGDNSAAAKKSSRGNSVSAKNDDDSDDDEASSGGAAPLPPVTPSGGTPRVRRITTRAMADSTRVTIDLEDAVQYSSARIKNPDRIFFDIHDARLPAEVAKANVKVEGDLVTAVRAAQNHAGIVRVVLDVNGVKEYNASLQDNPPALIIDLYAKTGAAKAANKGAKPVNPPVVDAKGEAELADVLPAGPANVTGKNKDKEIVPANEAKGVDAADLPADATAGSAPTPVAPAAAKRNGVGSGSAGAAGTTNNSAKSTPASSATTTAANSGTAGTAD